MSEVINVTKRSERGKRRMRRLRQSGQIPAILYGHGEEVISLSVPAEEIAAVIRHGSKIVDLRGAAKDKVLIREVQWDPFGIDVLHADFTRVSASEQVQVTVRLELRGEAPGVKEGGVLEHLVHEIELKCPVMSIPDKLELNVNSLNLGDLLRVSDVELPSGAELVSDGSRMAAQCTMPAVEEEEEVEAPAAETGEPEVIGRKAEEEEAEKDS